MHQRRLIRRRGGRQLWLPTYAAACLTDRQPALEQLEQYLGAARIAHEFVGELHRQLVELGVHDPRALGLLSESADVVPRQIPQLTSLLRELERDWEDRARLDPSAAHEMSAGIEDEFERIGPGLAGCNHSRFGDGRGSRMATEYAGALKPRWTRTAGSDRRRQCEPPRPAGRERS